MIIMLVIKMTKDVENHDDDDDGDDDDGDHDDHDDVENYDDDDDLSCHMTASQLVREPPSPGNQPLMMVMITMMMIMMMTMIMITMMTLMITCSGEADLGGSIGALLLGRVGRSCIFVLVGFLSIVLKVRGISVVPRASALWELPTCAGNIKPAVEARRPSSWWRWS